MGVVIQLAPQSLTPAPLPTMGLQVEGTIAPRLDLTQDLNQEALTTLSL
jgi:hypothetical protein